MVDFESKYNGPQVETMLDLIASDWDNKADEDYVNEAIAAAITATINASY